VDAAPVIPLVLALGLALLLYLLIVHVERQGRSRLGLDGPGGGNFRLVERLFAQIDRVAQINNMTHLTSEVVVAAQESLVIGAL
jgi:hypothetical protein